MVTVVVNSEVDGNDIGYAVEYNALSREALLKCSWY